MNEPIMPVNTGFIELIRAAAIMQQAISRRMLGAGDADRSDFWVSGAEQVAYAAAMEFLASHWRGTPGLPE